MLEIDSSGGSLERGVARGTEHLARALYVVDYCQRCVVFVDVVHAGGSLAALQERHVAGLVSNFAHHNAVVCAMAHHVARYEHGFGLGGYYFVCVV